MSMTVGPALKQDVSGEILQNSGRVKSNPYSSRANGGLSLSQRLLIFAVGNLSFGGLIAALVLLDDSGRDQATVYLLLLFQICSLPILFAAKMNGSYSILAAFTPIYFMFYGLSDVLSYLPELNSHAIHRTSEFLTEGEIAILVGALCLIAGYALVILQLDRTLSSRIHWDWALPTTTFLGVGLWLIGLWATWVWQTSYVDTQVRSTPDTAIGTGLTVLRMLQPLGSALLIYSYLKSRRKTLLVLLFLVMIIELPFGLVTDSKELAIRTGVLFLLSKWLFDGHIPYKWLIVGAIVILVTYPVSQAYRYEVLQTRAYSREKAFQNFANTLRIALASTAFGKEHGLAEGLQGFSGRINLKSNMEIIVNKTGHEVSFQNGKTISLLFYALVPRFIMPDKPDSSVGRVFNREFKVSLDPNTYISATHMGELFWNYGWPGLILGMFLIGGLLGTLGSSFSLADHKSVTRLLLLITTIYLLCLRFEGGIAMQYTIWIRSLIMITFLHFILRKRSLVVG